MIVGPRAVGKTTTARRRVETVVQLSVPRDARSFQADADAALAALREPVLLDEWQAVPEALGAARRSVDNDPRPGRFLLTGSVRAQLEQEVWPATGRITRISMFPMTVRERLGHVQRKTFFDELADGAELTAPADPPDLRGYVDLALEGGFPLPLLVLGTPDSRAAWAESYLDDLLTHDVEALEEPRTKTRDPIKLRRYLEAYALNSGGVYGLNTLYDAAQINRTTAIAYEELLTNLFIAQQLPAWTTNRLQRLVHQPKRHIVDTSLAAALLRLDTAGVLRDGDLLGRFLDTFVTAQLRPEVETSASRPRLHHLRTKNGRQEIDLLAELGGNRVIAIEIKATAAPKPEDARHLSWLRSRLGDRFVAGVVLHTGPRVYRLADAVTAVPIAAIWAA